MRKELFNIDEFNIIEDKENYYFFRAFNNADNFDIEQGIIIGIKGIKRIRTDRERYEEVKRNPKYSKNSKISLEQVYDHIKPQYRRDTNCISLSSNSNVSIVYGRGSYKDRYAIIKVNKKDMGKEVFNAGQYMLEEIEKQINNVIRNLDVEKDKGILNKILKIENIKTLEEVNEIILDLYSKKVAPKKKRYIGPNIKFIEKISATEIASSYQILSKEQTLEKNKIIAKLKVLELNKKINSIIPNNKNDAKLMAAIRNAFTSSEQIYYGDIPGELIKEVPKEIMDILSLLQQQDKNDEKVKKMKEEIIELIYSGYCTYKEENKTIKKNTNKIIKNLDYNVESVPEEELLCLIKSRERAEEIGKLLRKITKNNLEYEEIIENILENGYVIEPQIVALGNKGYKLSEAVGLSIKIM